MKNFLCIENLVLSSLETVSQIIQSSSEMEGCPITNILESEEKTLWLSTEELPQEITINLFKSFFKEFPKKISSIGIYCWHAYPTNPKLIEVLISKDKGKTYISLGNFDLCLKPGKQLLQLDDDSDYILSEDNNNDNLVIKLIIKETFGDKRTYINNIYLYEDINLCEKKLLTSMEPIKEEDSNTSMIYLRESRERTLPKSNIKSKKDDLDENNNNLKDLLEIDFDAKSDDEKNKNKKIDIKLGTESEFMMSDSELSEKYNSNKIKDNKKDEENNSIKINEESNNSLNNKENKNINFKNNERYFLEKIEKDELNYNNIIIGNEENHEVEEKEKSLNINDFNDDEDNENEKDIINNLNNFSVKNKIQNYMNNQNNEQANNSYREEDLNLLIEEFEDYKKVQSQKIKNYEKKLNYLENQFKEMTNLSNQMSNKINTILESQMNQKKENNDNLLNTMRTMINEKVYKVFRNFNRYSNFNPYYSVYPMRNAFSIPYNYNTIGVPDFDYNRNNNIVKRYKMNPGKNNSKNKNNILLVRNKSGLIINNKNNI